MEENVLKDFETFNEFPEKYLEITKDSNYYLIKKGNTSFIVKSKLDLLTFIKNKIFISKTYYDVITGENVLTENKVKNIDGSIEKFLELNENIEIIPLYDILGIEKTGVYYLGLDDLKSITNFKEENSKTYSLKPKKNYF